jgi:hypothetical protein
MAEMNGYKIWSALIGTFLLCAFYAGVSWNKLSVLAEDVESNTHHPVSATEIAILKVKQDAILEDVAEIKEDVKEMDSKIDKILQAVED